MPTDYRQRKGLSMPIDMSNRRMGLVVAHAAHLLTMIGVITRYRPRILVLTKASQGSGVGQCELIQAGFKKLGVDDLVTNLDIDETLSYEQALAGNFAFHASMVEPIAQWLRAHRIDVVWGDAYEATNYQHDIGCFLLHEAVAATDREIEQFEFPLSSQAEEPGSPLRYGVFVKGESETFELVPKELALKTMIVQWAARRNDFVNQVQDEFPGAQVEYFRRVPKDRDYLSSPRGLARYYDARGIEEVAAGRHARAISFDRHFRPLVAATRALLSKSENPSKASCV